MQFEQFFASAIEVAIAIAGFSGIVVVIGQRNQGKWTQADLARLSLLVQASFVAILLSFIPLVLGGAGVANATIWRTGSGAYIAYLSLSVPLRFPALRRLASDDSSTSPILIYGTVAVAMTLAILQLYNALLLASGWPFVLTILLQLAIAMAAFSRMLRALWQNSSA